jgi:SAM-dependent methyltransferase
VRRVQAFNKRIEANVMPDNPPPITAAPKPSSLDARHSSLDARYAERLQRKQNARWKRLVDVQAPYRWNLRRLQPGFTLDVGCGIGRNLLHLPGQSIGVDPNQHAIAAARARGLPAFSPDELRQSEYFRPDRFDSLLLAHVCEHLTESDNRKLLAEYLPLLRSGGQVILIAPQEAGYRSDPTHVAFLNFEGLRALLESLGVAPRQAYSFPFPRWAGRLFTYNEFVVVGQNS